MKRLVLALGAMALVSAIACSVLSDLDSLKGGGHEQPKPDAGLALGALCSSAASCGSGFCVAGVCCDTACDSPCSVCTAAGKESGESDGHCGPAKAGTDPRAECNDDGATSCRHDGKCDGKGACEFYPAGTRCSEPSCSGGVKTLPELCDGRGNCAAFGTVNCSPATCKGNLCPNDCTGPADCAPNEFCHTLTNVCTKKIATGELCTGATDCVSGFCVDGVCCESACTGLCQACSALLAQGQNGQCMPVTAGTDPDDDCAAEASDSCGNDGQCDGAGACRKYGASTACAASSCSGGIMTNAKSCDGAGNCKDNGTTTCAPFGCGPDACLKSCSSPSDCIPGSSCSAKVCSGQKSTGASCSNGAECQSGFCVDGVCCSSACTGACQACSLAAKGTGANGVCGNVVTGQDPHGSCAADPVASCGKDGTCDGNGGCRLWPSGTQCSSPSCAIDPSNNVTYLQSYADTCDGNGVCTDKGTLSCGLFTCNGAVCNTDCTSNAECAIGTCNTSTHVCAICSVSSVGSRSSPVSFLWLSFAIALGCLRRVRSSVEQPRGTP